MLANKVALITGAAQGIGFATARLLLRQGAKVSLLDISEIVGRAACSELQKDFSPGDVMFVPTDVTKGEQLKESFRKTREKFGGIDIVCNNAGLSSEVQWRKMIDINLVAMIEGTFLGLEYMSTQRGGRGGTIINVASLGGIVPMQYAPTYCASKHGIVGFSRSMKDCADTDGVRVNCICPEFVDTAMVRKDLDSIDENTKAFIMGIGLLSPERIAEGILELIRDTSRVGAVMTVTKKRGLAYFKLPGDQTNISAKL